MKKQKLRIGFDFDGVVAYNPARIIRAPIAYIKRNILGIKKLSFFKPRNKFEELLWLVVHDSSIFPARGITLLRQLVEEGHIEAHLITGRYDFLTEHLYVWLKKYDLTDLFTTINVNVHRRQPFLFKQQMLEALKLPYYIEDNLDIVEYLHTHQKAKIHWIYNILDRNHPYPYKYPYLEKALEDIIKNSHS